MLGDPLMKALVATLTLALSAVPAAGQQYPAKPVRMLVGFAPGGGVDITARLVAQKLTERWGKPVVVENRAGAAGNIATEIVAKSAPDGYTLLMAFSSHASNAALYEKLPFDVARDFTSVCLVATAPVVIAATASLPVKSLSELIAYAKARPGAVRFASSGVGTPVHLAGELMMQLTGIRITHVPYKGIAPAMAAMLGGETDITFPAVISGMQHFRNGRLKALAIASARRYPGLPDVPTAAEAGLAGFEVDYWYAAFGPAGLPRPVADRLTRDITAVVTTPEMRQSMLEQGSIAVGGGPNELDALVRRDYALWSKVVKAGGVEAE
jgi:tripartite-type tricarboxylate transporter receptor subunit TctC